MFHSRLWSTLHDHHMAPLGNLVHHGQQAVSLFFLLSGFVLSYNYRGRLRSTASKLRFYEARFARIYPAYLLSLLLMLLVTRGAMYPGNLLGISTLFMVQSWYPGHPEFGGVWNMVCWTLSVEAFFYILMPFLQTWIEPLKKRGLWIIVAVSLALALLGDVSAKSIGATGYPVPFNYISMPILHLPEFFIGGLLANILLLTPDQSPLRQSRYGLITWTGLLLALAVECSNVQRATLVLIPFTIFLLGLAVEHTIVSRLLGTRILVFGGAISYAMYLLQIPLKLVMRPMLAGVGIHGALNDTLAFALLLPILILISIPTYLWFEEPSRKLLRNLFALRGQHPAA